MWYSVGIAMLLCILFTINETFTMSHSNPIEVDEDDEKKNEGAAYALHKKKEDDSESDWGNDFVEVNKEHNEESMRGSFHEGFVPTPPKGTGQWGGGDYMNGTAFVEKKSHVGVAEGGSSRETFMGTMKQEAGDDAKGMVTTPLSKSAFQ